MNIKESILLALDAIVVNKLRASLTLLSISIGVFAIIGAASLVQSITSAVTDQLDELGENVFFISKMPSIQTGNTWRKYRNRKPITYSQVQEFKKRLTSTNDVCCYTASGGYVIKSGNLESDPDVVLIGSDEQFFPLYNVIVSKGRPFLAEDIEFNRDVAVIGNDIVVKVFPNINPLGKKIKIKNQQYTVIGILETQGAMFGQSQDNRAIIPVTQFLTYYADLWEESLRINVRAESRAALDNTIDESIGIMRSIRNVKPWEENSFELETNQSLAEQFASFTGFLSYFGVFSGSIALIAAGVGIMNIMLVSVKERTREIGVRKAIGARRTWILIQFIIETITLCQIGGFVGIVLGIGAGSLFGAMIGVKLALPVFWIVISVVICTVLGLVFGAYPAWKAAKLDPIDALRYE